MAWEGLARRHQRGLREGKVRGQGRSPTISLMVTG